MEIVNNDAAADGKKIVGQNSIFIKGSWGHQQRKVKFLFDPY